jgi:hypothetical protein
MRERIALAIVLTWLFACAIGCGKQVDRAAFNSAIDKSYDGRHVCVWAEPTKLPAQADPSKDEKIRDFEALTDAGLLTREVKEKKAPLLGQINKYTLSDQGLAAWTPVSDQPGFGNFCFGHFNVTAIDKATPNDPSNPTQYTVSYRFEVEGIPDWAIAPASMRAFHKIAADTSIQSGTATLIKSTNGGWEVASPQTAR